MISYLLRSLRRGISHLRHQPQILVILLLLVVLPILFFYSGQQFLDAGRANQDRLQKDRVGVLHDVFASLMRATDFDVAVMQSEIDELAKLNYDIIDFRIIKLENDTATPVAALHREDIGSFETFTDMIYGATVDLDQSLIYEVPTDEGRTWMTYRAVRHSDGSFYIIHTENSLAVVDQLFAQRERRAMMTLVYIFIFVLGLTYWHVRMTDYRYLYHKERSQSESKDTFINMMAHELRAPLTAIKGYSELVRDNSADVTNKQYADRIGISSERLLELINDLLDVARLQSGKLSVTLSYVDVSQTVQAVIHELAIVASEKNITISSVGTDTPHQAVADQKRLHQALANVVGNAIKYTEAGNIELELSQKFNAIEIRVKDTGMGINADDQKRLFAPFFRVQRADVSEITGTGLGMWITKQLVTLMHGKIGVESIRGVGTHIVISLTTKPDVIENNGDNL